MSKERDKIIEKLTNKIANSEEIRNKVNAEVVKTQFSENADIKSIGMTLVFLLASVDKINADIKKLQAAMIGDIINSSNENEH